MAQFDLIRYTKDTLESSILNAPLRGFLEALYYLYDPYFLDTQRKCFEESKQFVVGNGKQKSIYFIKSSKKLLKISDPECIFVYSTIKLHFKKTT